MRLDAPWTDEQVAALNLYQQRGEMHPFTCGICGAMLYATNNGWVCDDPKCGYTQTWAHDFMAQSVTHAESEEKT